MSNKIKSAVAYARFSSNNQREESIDAQKRQIDDYARQNGYKILTYYTDSAKSATTDDRPGFQQMFRDIPALKIDAVIVHKLDRFSRDRYDSALYRHKLKEQGVKLISVTENFDDSPESVILESVIEAMSEYYSKNLARETMKGLIENAYQCRHNGGKPPLGYDVDPTTHNYVINEKEAAVVRKIFDMYLNGDSYEAIVTYMNAHGCRTKVRQCLQQKQHTGYSEQRKIYRRVLFQCA